MEEWMGWEDAGLERMGFNFDRAVYGWERVREGASEWLIRWSNLIGPNRKVTCSLRAGTTTETLRVGGWIRCVLHWSQQAKLLRHGVFIRISKVLPY